MIAPGNSAFLNVRLLAGALLLSFSGTTWSAPETAQDLAWGEVLFDFYQQNHVAAITRLLVARKKAELPAHAQEAELVLGGLYLDYGMHQRAAGIFEQLLQQNAKPQIRDQAWYYLARIRFSRGDTEGASAALSRIGDSMPRSLRAPRIDLEARVLLDQGRPQDAASLLAEAELEGGWRFFGWYNLGVALVQSNQMIEGQEFLDRVGQARVSGPELISLKDRANLALGYARLADGNSEGARAALNRVSLEGPYTTKALLGAGWADAGRADYETALTPWSELGQRQAFDIAVQESLLAVPYAYGQLGANGQAVEHYQIAVHAYEAELMRLDGAVEDVRNGRLVDEILLEGEDSLADSPLQRYLYEMMAAHEFREAAADLQNMQRLSRLLEKRADNMSAFSDMLDARRARFLSRQPLAATDVDEVRLTGIKTRHQEMSDQLSNIRERRDVMALVNEQEARAAQRLEIVSKRVEGRPELAFQADRQRFLAGVLYWQVHSDFPQRLRTSERTHRDNGRVIESIQVQIDSVKEAGIAEPPRFDDFADRIDIAGRQLQMLRGRTGTVMLAQSEYLGNLAITELMARHQRVSDYLGQARFALAASYDRAAVAEVTN
ncbi:MAG: tetratricopeptide repeat protein [Gammaproteobacteria bacterium]